MYNPNPNFNYANLISVRSTVGSPAELPATMARLDLVLDKNGGLEDYAVMSPLKKLLSQKSHLITIIKNQQYTLVFKHRFHMSGYEIKTTLQMLITPNNTRRMIETFYAGKTNTHISTGLVMNELNAVVIREVSHNLSIIPLAAWVQDKRGEPVKNATRHTNLAQACTNIGFKLSYDQLDIEVTPARTA